MIILGCGYTGERVAWRRVFAGASVHAIVSSAERAGHLQASGLAADGWNLDQDETAPQWDNESPQPVVYLIPPPRSGDDDPRLAGALEGLDGAASRIVYVSTTGVYGNRDGALVTEDDPPTPESPRAVRRLAAEQRVRAWAESKGIVWIVLRVPGIYGPDRLQLATVREKRPLLRVDQAGPGNRIHADDLAVAVEAAAYCDAPSQVINVGDGNPMTNTEFVTEVARQLGETPPEQLDRDAMRARVSEQAWSFLRESRQVSVTKMRNVLGVTPRYASPVDGIAASLAAMNSADSD